MNDRITIADVRRAGYCTRGARRWFERYDLDFKAFLREGISEEKFRATGDACALDIIEKKRARSDG